MMTFCFGNFPNTFLASISPYFFFSNFILSFLKLMFMRTTILSTFLLLTTCFLFGQPSFKKGYIVNNNGDSIPGSIKEDVEEKLAQSINVRDQPGAAKILSVGDIKAFGFEGDNNLRLVNYIDPLDSLK